ncbi:ceramidase domain-containing protein [Piscinibacter sp.]|uniref:ceramidase domain-containing protein n=1 Tax=Piscinibacter sp. TaxID=1903157 RepID=UPI002D1149C8|nr:ceramidase domain-containing protein [Albitalea sp.]HUG22132.1 ceramidase domain-containing protein [Albitalea sp.]
MGMSNAAPRPGHTLSSRAVWLLAVAVAAVAALWWQGPIAQWASYHAFADDRPWFGIPNAANVFSNLPFALIGGWGLCRLAKQAPTGPAHAAWCWFSAAVACTALGSALYHWEPTNGWLVLDRLPIAWACATLTCALMAERVDRRWASSWTLGVAVVAGTLSVLYWWMTEQRGQGDLRPYLAVQFLPMLLVPAALALRLVPTGERAVPAGAWWTVLVLYAVAKVMELGDHAVLEALGVTSGHTLKHLLAAGAAWWLLRAATRTID